MTFIPDPTVLNCGDVVFLKRDLVIPNYGRFTKGHEFKVKGLPFRDSDLRYELWDGEHQIVMLLSSDVTKVRP